MLDVSGDPRIDVRYSLALLGLKIRRAKEKSSSKGTLGNSMVVFHSQLFIWRNQRDRSSSAGISVEVSVSTSQRDAERPLSQYGILVGVYFAWLRPTRIDCLD